MKRSDYVLAVMAAAQEPLTPVQVQKLFFILDQKIAPKVGGPHFRFVPYNYGPFDPIVYDELAQLTAQGLVVVDSSGQTRHYGVAPDGVLPGLNTFKAMPADAQDYVRRLVSWIRSVSFKQLVSAVYETWPAMKANSIFRG